MRLPLQLALVLLAGLAHALSMAEPSNGRPLWWLELLALGVLAWQLSSLRGSAAGARRGAMLGWVFATSWLTGTFWWLFISMHTYGGLPSVLAALAVVSLAGFLSLYYAAACGLWVKLAPDNTAAQATLFAALWLLAELMRAIWFTGFPWGAAGYAHSQGPLAGYAPWLGAYATSAVAAWLAMMLVQLRRTSALQRVALLAVLILPWGYQWSGYSFSAPAGTLSVTLLQGNIPQDEKFQGGTGVPLALRWYGEQIRDARTSLIVAPETAIPLLPAQLPSGYLEAMQRRFATGEQAVLVGIPLGNLQAGYSNSVIGLKPGLAQPYLYDKHHLVPFGEFIPPLFRWFTEMMNIPLGDFNRGAVGQPSFDWKGQRLAPNICYEDLFGEEIGTNFSDAARAPTILVNISNIGWFGNSIAIDQHLLISRMRALEFERPMIRATNTGATVIINHEGAVTHELERGTRGVLVGEVQGRTGITPFAWWVSRLGVWPLWLGGVLVVALAWLRRR
ncbi:MAG: apolipoprotein N-acyltransferase [Bdellovibrionales bacterium]|nr:apolipoprotein N-acyltransferase [Ramlibacter sp.]